MKSTKYFKNGLQLEKYNSNKFLVIQCIILFILAIAFAFILSRYADANTWVEDDLSTYPTGWSGDTGSFSVISTSTPWASSTNVLKLVGTGSTLEITKAIAPTGSSTQVICAYNSTSTAWNKIYTYGADEIDYVRFTDTGYAVWKHGGEGANSNIIEYQPNQWYCIKFYNINATDYQVVVWDINADTYTTTTQDTTTFGLDPNSAETFRIGESNTGTYYWTAIGTDFPSIEAEPTPTPTPTPTATPESTTTAYTFIDDGRIYPFMFIGIFGVFLTAFALTKK